MKISFKVLTIILLIATIGTLTACVEPANKTLATSTKEKLTTSTGLLYQPNMILDVKRQAGECPKTVGLWTFMLPFEGGAEHTVVPDTRSIASRARLITSRKNFLEYEATLNAKYASCTASANSQTPKVYNFDFRNGKVYFRLI